MKIARLREEMLKPYNYEILAVRITSENYSRLKKLDEGDGCLCFLTKEEAIGEWFVFINGGYEVMHGNTKLKPVPSCFFPPRYGRVSNK